MPKGKLTNTEIQLRILADVLGLFWAVAYARMSMAGGGSASPKVEAHATIACTIPPRQLRPFHRPIILRRRRSARVKAIWCVISRSACGNGLPAADASGDMLPEETSGSPGCRSIQTVRTRLVLPDKHHVDPVDVGGSCFMPASMPRTSAVT